MMYNVHHVQRIQRNRMERKKSIIQKTDKPTANQAWGELHWNVMHYITINEFFKVMHYITITLPMLCIKLQLHFTW